MPLMTYRNRFDYGLENCRRHIRQLLDTIGSLPLETMLTIFEGKTAKYYKIAMQSRCSQYSQQDRVDAALSVIDELERFLLKTPTTVDQYSAELDRLFSQ